MSIEWDFKDKRRPHRKARNRSRSPGTSQAPNSPASLRRRRIGLDAGNRHPLQSDLPGNLADVDGAGGQERLHLIDPASARP
jgi:hypothetical protein